ncbi:Fructose-16-bisphosphate aldolase [Rubrobacter radiotolerans]|uniref:Probable fructose-bisphosphate aldolase class 1 n=1 Tax=Rubrobacter radiotolerans TaxID=42256 RepID=A0A023X037_RUBRA|nr:class I fructose-bisphosphate aldolase [Rubrobacter radiotolerans]AHY45693.1 Fructose-16-bisphosphate aldolase [Rubrobacter radiotolerans]MDX5893107.1 class I fructose-bisphosphate aldolase [Rubrobacter radiotolerans]SMC03069.1 fructose-bisphosphate aldolase [Rubrobacter radiotolerans DSM 5868]
MEFSTLERLEETALELVSPGRGILAADESHGTIGKRFKAVGIESTEETRRDYREMLFTTEGISEVLSGSILFDETIRQDASDGRPLVEVLKEAGVIPGIKVDGGAVAMPLSPDEKVTQGLDRLRERLQEYSDLGARFTKWRAVITIGPDIPTSACVEANAQSLARFAAHSQEAGLVPIVEPEVLIDGEHTIEECYETTLWTLNRTFHHLYEHNVELSGMLLKPNMVISGKDAEEQAPVEEVAAMTVECLLRGVPAAVPGIVFLSGGQSDKQATAHLNAMNRMYEGLPWELSFSYARALQERPMETWAGKSENVEAAQRAFRHRLKMNAAARSGGYSEEMEDESAA